MRIEGFLLIVAAVIIGWLLWHFVHPLAGVLGALVPAEFGFFLLWDGIVLSRSELGPTSG